MLSGEGVWCTLKTGDSRRKDRLSGVPSPCNDAYDALLASYNPLDFDVLSFVKVAVPHVRLVDRDDLRLDGHPVDLPLLHAERALRRGAAADHHRARLHARGARACEEINECVGCTKSFRGDDAAVLAPFQR